MTTLPRRILSDAVAAVSHGEHVTLTVTTDGVTVAAADMWLTVATTIPTPAAPLTATIPTRQLIAEIKALPDGDIEIEACLAALRGERVPAWVVEV